MSSIFKRVSDRMLGRGDAAVTTPILDGALKPNQMLEAAPVVAEFTAATDIASDGITLFVADGASVKAIDADGMQRLAWTANGAITALAVTPDGWLAVAIDGTEVRVLDGERVVQAWRAVDGKPLRSVNALSFTRQGQLLATEGSADNGSEQWQRDLLTHGRSGRVMRFDVEAGTAATLASGLQWPFGVQQDGDGIRYAESWRHRLVSLSADGQARPVLDNIPGYPSRMAPAAGGGSWLTLFASRSQLIEFVLREPEFRQRMVAEVDPLYWIAPALSSGNSFLEPLQGAGVKQMGQLKPWAPPRSYGLVVRLDAAGHPRYSMHSRVGGLNHGIVAAAECHGALYVLARGPGRLLMLSLDVLREEFE